MRFLLNLLKLRNKSQGFFYQWEQASYERQMERVRTDPHYPFRKSA